MPYVRTQNQIKDKKNVLMQGEPRAAAVNFDTCRIFTARPHNLLCTAQIGMTIDPYYKRQKYGPISLVSGNIRCMWIFAGESNDSGVVDDGNFWRFRSYVFGNFRYKAGEIIWRYVPPCWPVIDCKMYDLG